MNQILMTILLLCFVTACSDSSLSNQEVVSQYYAAKDAGDYSAIKSLIKDSITVTAGDFVMPYDEYGFYEVFRWDSVFRPTYDVMDLQVEGDDVIVDVALRSLRNTFLHNKEMICNYKISLEAGRIINIAEGDCENADWQA